MHLTPALSQSQNPNPKPNARRASGLGTNLQRDSDENLGEPSSALSLHREGLKAELLATQREVEEIDKALATMREGQP